MGYLSIKPDFPLSLFINSVWIAESGSDVRGTEWVLPSSSTSVLINVSHGNTTVYDKTGTGALAHVHGAFIVGPLSEAHVIAPVAGEIVCGFEFKLGGAFALLGGELQELGSSIHELSATTVQWHRENLDAIRAAGTPARRVEILCGQLNHLLNFEHTVSPMLLAALRSINADHQILIKDLAANLGVTSRRLQRVFVQGLGASPKKYARSQRFKWVIENIRRNPSDIDWSTLALAGGFSDQSHLVHECQSVVGVAPNVLSRQVQLSGHPYHIALP